MRDDSERTRTGAEPAPHSVVILFPQDSTHVRGTSDRQRADGARTPEKAASGDFHQGVVVQRLWPLRRLLQTCALEMEGDVAHVLAAEKCTRCLQCEAICPDFAIQVHERPAESVGGSAAS